MDNIRISNNIDDYNTVDTRQTAISKFIINARQLGLTKTKKWLFRLIDRNKLGYFNIRGLDYTHHQLFDGSTNITRFKEQLSLLIDLLNSHYGSNWDMQIDYDYSLDVYLPSVLIHYDTLTIENSEGRSRQINDLIVCLCISNANEGICFYKPRGTRVTLQADEWSSTYMHSHLPKKLIQSRTKTLSVDQFCIGSQDMDETIIEIKADAFDIQKFELFFMLLDNYVKWESLEGGPHIRMENITIQKKDNRFAMSTDSQFNMYHVLFGYLNENNIPFPANFVYSDGRFKVKHDETYKEGIKNLFVTSLINVSDKVLCKKGADGHFYKANLVDTDTKFPQTFLKSIKINGELPYVYISGKKITFDITNQEKVEKTNIDECIIYPQFLNYVSEQLEIHLYESCVTSAGVYALANSNDNVAGVSEQSQVSLF